MRRDFVFHEGDLPSDYRYGFEVAVFNTTAFRMLHAMTGWFSFYILHPTTLSVQGHLHVHVDAGVARSPLRAPFGSVEISSGLPPETLYDFLEFVESKLGDAGVRKIVVTNPPDAYDPGQRALVNSFFTMRGYGVLAADIGSIIPVSDEPFGGRLHPRKKRKLAQSRRHNFRFALLHADAKKTVYDFVAECRHTKGYKLSITFNDLQKAMDRFPKSYLLFGVFMNDKLLAASVAIRVNGNVLYHFISDHVRNMGSFSPGLVLMEGIYLYCQKKSIAVLDLGTSMVDAKPNFKLFNFKRELGGKPTTRFTFKKTINT